MAAYSTSRVYRATFYSETINVKTLFTVFLILSSGVHSAWAEGANAQFGAVYGSSVPDADNTKPYWMTGVKGSAYVFPSISLGGYYLWSDSSGQPSSTEKFKYSLHGVDAAYHVASGQGEMFFSLRGGFSKVEQRTSSVDITFSPYHIGFGTGYDYFLTPWAALGFEGSLIHVKKSNTYSSAIEYKLENFNIISFLITLQYRM